MKVFCIYELEASFDVFSFFSILIMFLSFQNQSLTAPIASEFQ